MQRIGAHILCLALICPLTVEAEQAAGSAETGEVMIPVPALPAPATNSVKVGAVTAELIAEPTHIEPGVPFWVALWLKMDDEWHTYWRNPGDSGGPTEIEWILPEGFEAGAIEWPAPRRIDTPPMTSYGYENEVLLLTRITPPAQLEESAEGVAIGASAEWLMCRDVCLPGRADLEIVLPVKLHPAEAASQAASFSTTRARLPASDSGWQFEGKASSGLLELFAIPPDSLKGKINKAGFFPYDPELIDHPFSQLWMPTDNGYRLVMKRSDYADELPERLDGVLVWGEQDLAVEAKAEWIGP